MDLNLFCSEWLSAWTGNRPDKLLAFYSEDAFYRDPAKPEGLRGTELALYFKKLLARNPDWKWEAVEILPTAKGFCLKWTATIPVGSQVIHETGLDIVELEGQKIIRNEVYFDRASLIKASGV
jgi:hypothetical protein